LNIFIHVDADPDRGFVGGNKLIARHGRQAYDLKWNGLLATLNYLEKFTDKFQGFGLGFKSTFFLRADEQIKNLYGTYCGAFMRFYDNIRQLSSVGWHPHLYRWSNLNRCWYQECHDNEWMRKVLTDCHEDLELHGFYAQFAKMGWCFHNNTTMKTLSDLGLSADFSALPGAKCLGHLEGKSVLDVYDWSKTEPQPYHPSEEDYQKAGGLDIFEIPLTTYKVSGPLVFLYTTKLTLESYIKFRLRGYSPSSQVMFPLGLLNLSKKQNLKKILELMLKLKENDYITLYFHPDDLLDINIQNILENVILRLFSNAEKHGVELSFVDASELYSLIRTK